MGLHAAVLGLQAAAATAPYDIPDWLPDVLGVPPHRPPPPGVPPQRSVHAPSNAVHLATNDNEAEALRPD